jgi:hypothetical protein
MGENAINSQGEVRLTELVLQGLWKLFYFIVILIMLRVEIRGKVTLLKNM